jgi:ABC-type transporter Mla subunit MlaD
MKTPIETLIKALRILANDIQSDDGVANAAISEAANRLEEQQKRIQRLVEEGDEMLMWLGEDTYPCNLQWLQDQWTKAKEGL